MWHIKYTLFLFLFIRFASASVVFKEPLDATSIPELNYLNRSADPCIDFYEFSCGYFEKYNPLPDGKKFWDSFAILQEKIDKISTEIISSEKQEDDPVAVKKVIDMYQACMDNNIYGGSDRLIGLERMVQAVEDLGGWPLISDKKYHKKKFSWNKLADVIADYGLPLFISWSVIPFIMNATQYMISISQDDLQLPTSLTNSEENNLPGDIFADIFNPDKKFGTGDDVNPYAKYVKNIALTLNQKMGPTLVNPINVLDGINDVIDVMRKIKQSPNYPREVNFEPPPTTIEELQKWSDSFAQNYTTRIDWFTFFKKAFKHSHAVINKNTKVWVSKTNGLANILDIVENTDPLILKNLVMTRLTTYMAPDSTNELWESYNQLYRDLYQDKYPIFSRPEYCRRKIMNSIPMSMAVAFVYHTYYFQNEKITVAREMIEDLRTSFSEILNEKDWLDDKSKKAAQTKLDKLIYQIGFPDFIFDSTKTDEYFSSLMVCRHDHFGNVQRLRAFNMAKSVQVLGYQRDRTIWGNSPMVVNAFYNPQNNRIVFPAAIMNPPFYTGQYSVLDYGKIGAIIGHEITHGFDSQGIGSDGDGNIGAIWSKDIRDIFANKTHCFENQYWKYYIEEIDKYVNGTHSLAENIADNGGLREAYKAYLKLKSRTKLPQIEDFTNEQMFFIAFATSWCRVDTDESLTQMYGTPNDKHAPNKYRVRGTVSNMDEFAQAFNCPLGSPMHPDNKCLLW